MKMKLILVIYLLFESTKCVYATSRLILKEGANGLLRSQSAVFRENRTLSSLTTLRKISTTSSQNSLFHNNNFSKPLINVRKIFSSNYFFRTGDLPQRIQSLMKYGKVKRSDLNISEDEKIHLDLGGCGYNNYGGGLTTGFYNSININVINECGVRVINPYTISNLVKILKFPSLEGPMVKDPYPLDDNFADYITLQSAPLTDANVIEIKRMLRLGGRVGLWIDLSETHKTKVRMLANLMGTTPGYNRYDSFHGQAYFEPIEMFNTGLLVGFQNTADNCINLNYTCGDLTSTVQSYRPYYDGRQSTWLTDSMPSLISLPYNSANFPKLLMAYKELSTNIIRFSTSFDGINWSQPYLPMVPPNTSLVEWKTPSSPCMAIFQNKIYLALRTSDNKIAISSSYFGCLWEPLVVINADWGTSDVLSMSVFTDSQNQTKLYMAIKGHETSTWQNVYIASSSNGTEWTRYQQSGWGVKLPISITTFNNKLYMACVANPNLISVATSSTGVNGSWEWLDRIHSQNWSTLDAVNLSTYNNKMYLLIKGTGNTGDTRTYYTSTSDGVNWSERTAIPNVLSNSALFGIHAFK